MTAIHCFYTIFQLILVIVRLLNCVFIYVLFNRFGEKAAKVKKRVLIVMKEPVS